VVTLAAGFAVPGSLDTPTGGYAYDRRMIAELRGRGWHIDVLDLGEGFPDPSPQTRADALAALRTTKGRGPLVIDGLALGILPEAPVALAGRRPVIALVHHPLACETGLSPERAAALQASEQAALAAVAHVVATSETTAALLAADYAVPPVRISVAPPGCDREPRAIGSDNNGTVNLLAVGSLVPRKGYDTLLAALAPLRDLPWHLTIVGDPTRSPGTAEALMKQAHSLGLDHKVTFAGAVPEAVLAERYAAADLFVLASRFEGYGMAFTEALVRGVPVIATSGGAVASTVPPGCGLLVPPDDVAALSQALSVAIIDRERRRAWSEAAWTAGQRFPTWEASADIFAAALRSTL
jgi:glycosyltransferase involved in cell wall biosynthesis